MSRHHASYVLFKSNYFHVDITAIVNFSKINSVYKLWINYVLLYKYLYLFHYENVK